VKKRKATWMMYAFIAAPVLFFAAQFLPFYHSGTQYLPSLWSMFWYPELEANQQALEFIGLFHWWFRVNDLVSALLTTQLLGIFLVIASLILKGNGVVAFIGGCWGLYGIISFLVTPSLAFSRVLAYGGIAGILMLATFLGAVAVSGFYFFKVYRTYKKNLAIHNASLQAR
jgi:hypothetical protein